MPDVVITNCHVHIFTNRNVPAGYLPLGAMRALSTPYVRRPLIWLLERGIFWKFGDRGERAARFARIGALGGQSDIFRIISGYYPRSTRFVVLPMDMAFMGAGDPPEELARQHNDLATLAAEFSDCVLPFAAADPRRPGMMAEVRRCVEQLGFHGVKLYPPLGYAPTHELLMRELYPYCIERNIPVMSHCSQGGVRQKGLSDEAQARFASPEAFAPALQEHPKLRVCLAHFGGGRAWDEYLGRPHRGPVLDREEFRKENWLAMLLDMLRSGDYPNLFTDISYTAFNIAQNLPALDVFLNDKRVLERTLFGSDFYMAELENVSERRVSIELRHRIGDVKFRQIAETNPKLYLEGRASDRPAGG